MTTTKTIDRFHTVVVLVAVLLFGVVLWPIATPVFFAVVLAGVVSPTFERLARRLRNRRTLAASLLTGGLLLAVVGPLAGLVSMFVAQAQGAAAMLQEVTRDGRLTEIIGRLPQVLQGTAGALADRAPDLVALLQTGGSQMAATVGSVISSTGRALLALALTFIGLFFMLLEGSNLITWAEGLVPMRAGELRSLLAEFRVVSRSVLLSVGATAAAQAICAFVGLIIARVPNPLFLSLVCFFLALVPALGAGVGFALLGVAYLVGGSTGTGIFLVVWAAAVIGLVDNLVRPLVIGDAAAMHGGLVFFSLVGGVASFGIAGLLAGPLTVALFIAVMRVESRRRAQSQGATPRATP